MKKLVIISMVVVLFLGANALAGDRHRRGHHDNYRFDRNFEKSFGIMLGIGAGIIATDIINQTFNPRYYSPYYHYQPCKKIIYGYINPYGNFIPTSHRRICGPRY